MLSPRYIGRYFIPIHQRYIKILILIAFITLLLNLHTEAEGYSGNLTYFGRHSLSFPEALGGKSSIDDYSELINEIIKNFRSITSLEALSEALNLVEECPSLECLAYEPELVERVGRSLSNFARSNIESRDITQEALTVIEVVGLTDNELISLISNEDLKSRLEGLGVLNRESLYSEIQETMNIARWMYSEGSITSIEYAAALELLKRISSSRALDDLTVLLSRDQVELIRNILTEAFQKSVAYNEIRDPWLLASIGASNYRSSSIDLIDRLYGGDKPLSERYLLPSLHASFASGILTLFGGSRSITSATLMFVGALILGFLILVQSNTISRNIDRLLYRISRNIDRLKIIRGVGRIDYSSDIVSIYWKAVELISVNTGIYIDSSETHREYLNKISSRLSLFKDLFSELTEIYEKKRFGGYGGVKHVERAKYIFMRLKRIYS